MEPTSTDATREPSNGPAAKLPGTKDAAKPDPKTTPKAKPKKKGTKKAPDAPAAKAKVPKAKVPKAKVPKASGKKVKADPPTKPAQKKKERKRKAKDGEEGASPARKAKATKAKSAGKKRPKKSPGKSSKAASGDPAPAYLGVARRGGQYEATVQRGSRVYNLGLYKLAADAAAARDAAYRISAPDGTSRGGALANNDAEGIQRALHWLDGHAQDMSSPKSGAEGGVNFATPAEYRAARQLELQASGLDYGLDEEGLKLRIKKEILNLARAYVDNPPSPVQDPPVGHAGSEQGSDASASASSQEGKGRKRKAASSLLKKKTWTPDPEEDDADEVEDEDVTAQAAALLGLKRSPGSDPTAEATYGDAKVAAAKARSGSIAETPAEKEKKKGALAKKLQAMMGGADASGASQTSAVGAVGAGSAVVIAEGHATAAPAAAPPATTAAATLPNPTLPPGTTEDPGLRTLLLLRQAQLDQERRAMVDLAAARLPSSSSGADPALEQLLALAAQRPDLVNAGALQAAVQARAPRPAPRPAPPAAPTVPVSTLPAGLVEHLATLQAPEEDPLQVIQKRLAKEEKRAALAKKLSALMSGATPGTAAVVEPDATPGRKDDEGGEANSASATAAQLQRQQQQQLDALQALQGPARVPLGAKDEQEQQLQTLRMLQALSRDAPPTAASRANTEQEALLQSLAVKKQLAELNRAALEQKLQQYMQGGGSAAPSPTSAVSLPPSLQANNRTSLQALLEEQRARNAQNAMAQEAVRRRAMVESLVLASEEDRLRRMREELQRQLASPQMGALGSPLLGAAAGSLGTDLVRRALASSEAAASAAEHRAQVERRSQEMELQQALALRAATLEGQAERSSQEMELRQALALRAAVLEGQKRGSGL